MNIPDDLVAIWNIKFSKEGVIICSKNKSTIELLNREYQAGLLRVGRIEAQT